MWKLEIVEPVREWLHALRKDDPELARQIAARIQLLITDGPGLGRPLVDSLAGERARRIGLKELRTHGTIRIAFVFHSGVVVLLLASGDKRTVASRKFYTRLIEDAEQQYAAWLDD